MNIFAKIGLAVLAGTAVLLGINSVEKSCKEDANKEDTMTSSFDDEVDEVIIEEPSPKRKVFARKLKKVQGVVERVSSIITCICRIVDCIGDLFKDNRRSYATATSYGSSTTIIF